MKYEMKKMFLYRKGACYIFSIMLIYILASLIMNPPQNFLIDVYYDEYSYYLEKIMGELDTEKSTYIEQESKNISNAKVSLEKLYDDYYMGNVDELEFQNKVDELNNIIVNENGFKQIFNQYLYINEKPTNRYFLYTNGWNNILVDDSKDWLLVLGVVLLIIPLYCYEYNSKMNEIIITTQNGSVNTNINKIALSVLVTSTIGITSSLIDYCIIKSKYTLENGEFPLQSLEYFGSSTKDISLFNTFIYMTCFKILGLVLLALTIILISIIFKKVTLSILIFILTMILPYAVLSKKILSYIPLPTTFIMNSFLFEGDINEYNHFTKETTNIFSEVSFESIIVLLLLSIIFLLFSIVFILNYNKNKHFKFAKKTIVLYVLLMLTSCSNEVVTDNDIVFNSVDRGIFSNDLGDYFVDDYNDFMPTYIDAITEEKFALFRSPVIDDTSISRSIYGVENTIYYSYILLDNTNFRGSSYNKIVFVELDTNTYNERVYFEKKLTSLNDEWNILHSFTSFFVYDDHLFLHGESLYKINVKTNKVDIIDISTNNNIAFDGEYIYYIGDKSILYKYDIANDTHISSSEIATSHFYLIEDSILFINRKDGNSIYTMDKYFNNLQLLYKDNFQYFSVEDTQILGTIVKGEVEKFEY